jgi:GrpB-like predicted nucleotidyltransferase (UPF0157 family)
VLIFNTAQKMLHNVLGNPHTNMKKIGTTVVEENVTVHKVISNILIFIGQTGRYVQLDVTLYGRNGKR